MNKPLRHGEILLLPVTKLPKGELSQHTHYIVGHSETGHHHVLESTEEFTILKAVDDSVWVEINRATKLVHKKQVDKHKTLPVSPGKYQVIYKNEFNPFTQLIQRVQD